MRIDPRVSDSSILVVAPHPDDEVLGCGGTIARHTSGGCDVNVLIVTRGVPELFPPEEIEKTRCELDRAHSILGISETVFLDFPAPKLDVVPNHEVADEIRRVILDFSPSIVYFPHYGDLHADHKVVHYATLVATRPVDGSSVNRLLCYETLSETDWGMPVGSEAFVPNVFVEISEYLDVKLAAMACYESQLSRGPRSRAPEILRSLAHLRGATANLDAAEAFMLLREIY